MLRNSLLCLALIAATLATFWSVQFCGFVAYDDPAYVAANPMVNQALRAAAWQWAWSAPHGGNWHPLTSLSHMADCSLFGLRAGAHHLANLGWHLLNVVLVGAVWRGLGHGVWPAAAVGALFAVHPLHVESVAWISARKDLLSTTLWLATLLAYVRYSERWTGGRYAVVALGTALAMMAKPMAVTLPATLLLLDWWPLRRWQMRGWRGLLGEKAPLFALAALCGVATWLAQHAAEATKFGEQWSLGERAGNALVACVRYLGKTIWPSALAPFYPHPGAWPWWAVLGAVSLLTGGCAVAWRERARRPWFAWGWLWFLGTLAPTLGLVQVGAQSMADRYTYVPLLGIFTIAARGGAEIAQRWPRARSALAVLGVVVIGACAVRSARQVAVWKDGVRLAEQIALVAGEHPIGYREMGAALAFAGRPAAEVEAQYRRGLELAPRDGFFLNELGLIAARAGRHAEALALMERLRDALPHEPAAWTNLASVQTMAGQLDAATYTTRHALALQPDYGDAHRVLAQIFVGRGRLSDARAELETAVRLDPWSWVLHNELGVVLISLDRVADGIAALERALWIHPGDEAARTNLALARQRAGR
jgi:Tfp pilus assembly protein PilF